MMNSPTPELLDRVHRETATDMVRQLSNVEKASLCTGRTFWELQGVERFNLPSIWVTDGPHGLRKQQGDSDHIGLSDSVPAICFPRRSVWRAVGTGVYCWQWVRHLGRPA